MRGRCFDLSRKHGIHPPGGVVEWGTTPKDFFERKAAIIYTTTGNLTNIRNNAGFKFGVAMLPENKRRGSPTGGGNFYMFKKATPQERAAALKFVQWMTTPGARCRLVHLHRLCGCNARSVEHPCHEEISYRLPAPTVAL